MPPRKRPLPLDVGTGAGARARAGSGTRASPVPSLHQHLQNPDQVLELLQQGARVDELDGNGLTPLMRAAGLGSVAIVEHLLAFGADLNRKKRRSRDPYAFPGMMGHAPDEFTACTCDPRALLRFSHVPYLDRCFLKQCTWRARPATRTWCASCWSTARRSTSRRRTARRHCWPRRVAVT
jgi:hypothetical protein